MWVSAKLQLPARNKRVEVSTPPPGNPPRPAGGGATLQSYCFTVPGEPRGKQRPRFVATPAGGRTYTPAETVAAERQIAWCAKAAGVRRIEGPVAIVITAWLQIPASASKARKAAMLAGLPTKRPDFDNIAKLVCDALNGVAWADDAQITDMHFSKRWADEPCIDVTITAARP